MRREDKKTTTTQAVLEKTLRSSRFVLFIVVRWLGALLFAHKVSVPFFHSRQTQQSFSEETERKGNLYL